MNDINPAFLLPDVQSTLDSRRIAIQRVGVKGVRYPVRIGTPHGIQNSVGMFDLDVHLPATQKGTHMSRFIALLEENESGVDLAGIRALLRKMLPRLDAESGRISVKFAYFIEKTAPVSGVRSLLDYEVTLTGVAHGDETRTWIKVLVPVTSLCPCSKEISSYGAHNQRSHVTIDAELAGDIAIEELVRLAERQASCELWGLLKRPDEKYVTERAYENPKFVEDLVRDIAAGLDEDDRIVSYVLEAENFESIHNHSAYAVVTADKRVAAIQ